MRAGDSTRLAMTARIARALLLGVLAAAGLAGCAREPAKLPRNILLITIDTLRSDKVAAYGNPIMRTPSLDRLAREGVVFASARSPIPLTLPSHTSILTGVYPRTHLVLSHAYTLAPGRRTLAEILKEHGYATAAFVSSHVLDKKYGLDRGFDSYWQRWNADAGATRALNEAGRELTTKAVTQWLRARVADAAAPAPEPAPFFLWAHYFHPHKPYTPPPPLDRLYDPDYSGTVVAAVDTLRRIWKDQVVLEDADLAHLVALYQGEVTASDAEVGKLVSVLEREGLLDDTIVIVTADHGEVLYEHDFYFGHDIMLYGPALDVPMIVRGKGLVPEGRVVTEPVRLIDLAPTILDAVGIPPGEVAPFEGTSLLGLARAAGARGERSRAGAAAPPETAFAEVFPPKAEWKSEPRHAVETPQWKMILTDGVDRRELYDLVRDPRERNDLAALRPDTLAAYLAVWDAWRASKEKEFVQTLPEIDAETEAMLRSLGYLDN